MAKFLTNQVAPPGGQFFQFMQVASLVATIITNTSVATWWPNIQLMQMASTGMKYKDIVPRNIAHQICEKYTFLEKKYTKEI